MIPCAVCGEPAARLVRNVQRKTGKVLHEAPLCHEHVQTQLTLASTPGLGMTDVEIDDLPSDPDFDEMVKRRLKETYHEVLTDKVGEPAAELIEAMYPITEDESD